MDTAALTDLLARHAGLIRKVAAAYCRDRGGRDDVVQEILLQLWRSRERYDGRCKESTWVYRVALNTAIARHRRERRHAEGRREGVPLDELPRAAGDDERDAIVERLVAAIGTLPALDRALVLLHLDGNDHATVAEVLGLTPSNVGTKLHRLKATLREALARLDSTHHHEPR